MNRQFVSQNKKNRYSATPITVTATTGTPGTKPIGRYGALEATATLQVEAVDSSYPERHHGEDCSSYSSNLDGLLLPDIVWLTMYSEKKYS